MSFKSMTGARAPASATVRRAGREPDRRGGRDRRPDPPCRRHRPGPR
jgi:hypothetical protein